MTKSLSILNIGGHPKDAIIYAGGTMAKHAARGDKVTMLTPTTGLSHHLQAIDEYRKSGNMPDMSSLVDAANELGVPHGPRRSRAWPWSPTTGLRSPASTLDPDFLEQQRWEQLEMALEA